MLLEGKGVNEVARLVGASPSSAQRWKEAMESGGGMEALKAKPHPGGKPRLSARQKEELKETLLEGPLACGYETDVWTLRRVAQVIERRFGVEYHHCWVWYILRSLGFSYQKPERRARERDEARIERWRKVDWPRIKKSL